MRPGRCSRRRLHSISGSDRGWDRAPAPSSRLARRRIAIHAQLLDAPRPTDLVAVVDRLTFLQIDPTAAIAPSADLVLWSRLGSSYAPAALTKAVEQDRTLVETVAYIRTPRDVPAVIAEVRDAEPYAFTAAWLETNEPFRRDILALLEKEGPLLSRDIPGDRRLGADGSEQGP